MYLKNNFINGQQLTKRKIQNLENGCRQLIEKELKNDLFYAQGVKQILEYPLYFQNKNWLNLTGGAVEQNSGTSLLKFYNVNDACSLVFSTSKDFTKNNSNMTFSDGTDLYICLQLAIDDFTWGYTNDTTKFRIKIHYDNYLTETNYSYYDMSRYEVVNTIYFAYLKSLMIKLSNFTDVGTKDLTSVKGISISVLNYNAGESYLYIDCIQLQKESLLKPGHCTPYFEKVGDNWVEKFWSRDGALIDKKLIIFNYSLGFYKRLDFTNKYDFVVYSKLYVKDTRDFQYQGIGIINRNLDESINWKFYISKSSNSTGYSFNLTNEKGYSIASKTTDIVTLQPTDVLNLWLYKEGNNITGILQCERLIKYHSFCCEFAELSNIVDVYYGNSSAENNNVCNCILKEFNIYGI